MSGLPSLWWVSPFSAVAGVTIGSSIPLLSAGHRRRLERHGEVIAMMSENYQARLRMRTLIRGPVRAPLYRLPTTIFKLALPNLIGDGHLTKPEIDTLVEYINRADELNRGLERAGAAHAAHPDGGRLLEDEYNRNVAKADEILNEQDPNRFSGVPLIDAADHCLHRMDDLYSRNWLKHLFRHRGENTGKLKS